MIAINGITFSKNMNLNKLQEILEDREAWHAVVHGVSKSWTQLSDWPTIITTNQKVDSGPIPGNPHPFPQIE